VFFENRDNGVPNGFALSLAFSHGEREQMAGNHNNGRTSVIRFPLSVGEGANCRESKHGRTSVICSLSPWERARERAKTVKPT